jgi:hypothetical protein
MKEQIDGGAFACFLVSRGCGANALAPTRKEATQSLEILMVAASMFFDGCVMFPSFLLFFAKLDGRGGRGGRGHQRKVTPVFLQAKGLVVWRRLSISYT